MSLATEEPPTKKFKENDDTTVIEEPVGIPEDKVFNVVGQANATLNMIEMVTGAKVLVGDRVPNAKTRTITLKGTRPQVEYCKTVIQQKCQTNVNATISANPQGNTEIKHIRRVLKVPDDQVGRIIGRQGSTIRQIQELSGVHMDIAKECRSGSREREVLLQGLEQQVEYASELIQKKLAGEYLPLPPSAGFAPDELKVTIPDNMVGRIIGRGGQTIREIQDMTGSHMDIAKDATPGTDLREIVLRGTPHQVQECMKIINERVAEVTGDYTRSYVQPAQEYTQIFERFAGRPAGPKPPQRQQQKYPFGSSDPYTPYMQQYAQQYRESEDLKPLRTKKTLKKLKKKEAEEKARQEKLDAAEGKEPKSAWLVALERLQDVAPALYSTTVEALTKKEEPQEEPESTDANPTQNQEQTQEQQPSQEQTQQQQADEARAETPEYIAWFKEYYEYYKKFPENQPVPKQFQGMQQQASSEPAAPPAQETSTLSVPKDMLPRIYGNNGELVNQMQQETGAKIDIPYVGGASVQTINITGTKDQVEACRARIQQAMASRF